eukprot:scaffold725_cov133-Cylindrotheca_fusiformis.AAC.14
MSDVGDSGVDQFDAEYLEAMEFLKGFGMANENKRRSCEKVSIASNFSLPGMDTETCNGGWSVPKSTCSR